MNRLGPASQWTALIVLSVGIGAVLLWLHAPAALMLGPLVAGIVIASGGGKVRFPLPAFVVAQGIIGCMIARMVPLSILGDILSHWLLFSAGIVSVVVACSLMGWLMTRLHLLPGTTALWGMSPGAASVMTIMAESYGADIRLVAFMQYLRVVGVAAVASLVAKMFGVSASHGPAAIVWFPPVAWLPLAETLALAILGPLIVGCTLVLIAICGAVAALMVVGAGVDPLTAYLATSPGGSDSIAIIAASTNVDVSFVMAMQTFRMITVMFLAPVLTKFIAKRINASGGSAL